MDDFYASGIFSLPKKDYPSAIIMFVMWASLSGLIIFSFID